MIRRGGCKAIPIGSDLLVLSTLHRRDTIAICNDSVGGRVQLTRGVMDGPQLQELRKTIAESCRLLALLGLVREATGHVSARLDDRTMLIRCRGKDEAGLAFTRPDYARACDFSGGALDGAGDYAAPMELPIHGELYRTRPEIGAVVHAHAPAAMTCSLAGLELKPIFGSYDPDALWLALDGVPVFPRSALIRDPTLAGDMAACMSGKSVCVLYGHGVVATGATVEEATLRAIRLETLAQTTLAVVHAGGKPVSIGDDDLAFFQGLRARSSDQNLARNMTAGTWRHYMKLLERHEGRAPRF